MAAGCKTVLQNAADNVKHFKHKSAKIKMVPVQYT